MVKAAVVMLVLVLLLVPLVLVPFCCSLCLSARLGSWWLTLVLAPLVVLGPPVFFFIYAPLLRLLSAGCGYGNDTWAWEVSGVAGLWALLLACVLAPCGGLALVLRRAVALPLALLPLVGLFLDEWKLL